MAIYWDGRVPLCCADLNGDHIIGDANKHGLFILNEFVHTKAYLQTAHDPDLEPCNKCERYGNQ
jgi:hypothetical protein